MSTKAAYAVASFCIGNAIPSSSSFPSMLRFLRRRATRIYSSRRNVFGDKLVKKKRCRCFQDDRLVLGRRGDGLPFQVLGHPGCSRATISARIVLECTTCIRDSERHQSRIGTSSKRHL
jgi:hypothetical protein